MSIVSLYGRISTDSTIEAAIYPRGCSNFEFGIICMLFWLGNHLLQYQVLGVHMYKLICTFLIQALTYIYPLHNLLGGKSRKGNFGVRIRKMSFNYSTCQSSIFSPLSLFFSFFLFLSLYVYIWSVYLDGDFCLKLFA